MKVFLEILMLWRAVVRIRAFTSFRQPALPSMIVISSTEALAQHRCLAGGPLRALGLNAGATVFLHSCNIHKPLEAQKIAARFRCFASTSTEMRGDIGSPPIDPDALHLPRYCAGCGVGLQAEDPDLPG